MIPLVPRALGLETEYGILMRGAGRSDPFSASRILLSQFANGVPCESGDGDRPRPRVDLMLENGARFYIDHAHPEYSTPEVTGAREAVAADKAGEVIVDACRRRAEQSAGWPAGAELMLYKNNSDQKGRSYGCHENYLVDPELYRRLVGAAAGPALATLVPFLVSRSLLCGAGKVGSENDTPPAAFQLTQRADFFESIVGLQTTHHRPLINTRDEPHALGQRHRRFHVIVGDANLAETSTFLKVGTALLVLAMLESGVALPDLTLGDPLAAFRIVSRDLSFGEKLPLQSGERCTALQMQRMFLQHARRHVDESAHSAPGPEGEPREILALWADTLDRMERDWRLLASRLDWAIKRSLLESYLDQQRSSWDEVAAWQPAIEATRALSRPDGSIVEAPEALAARVRAIEGGAEVEGYLRSRGLDWGEYWRQRAIYYRLRRLDMEYHDVSRGPEAPGLFHRLQLGGAVDRVVTDADVEGYVDQPPASTRAYLRGQCVRRFRGRIQRADWSEIRFADAGDEGPLRLELADPTGDTRADLEELLATEPSPAQLAARRHDKMTRAVPAKGDP